MDLRSNLNANLNSCGLKSLDFNAAGTSQAGGINRREFIMTSLVLVLRLHLTRLWRKPLAPMTMA